MALTLRIAMAVLGAGAILIALSMLAFGPEHTIAPGLALFGDPRQEAVLEALRSADVNSELRFYAALWLAFGVLAVRASRNPAAAGSPTPWLALVLFLGGLGRLWSLIAIGAPHPFFIVLMAIELVLPTVIWLLWAKAARGR